MNDHAPALKASWMHGLEQLRLRRSPTGELQVSVDDSTWIDGVEVVPCFPLSTPSEYVTLLDGRGHELVCLRDLSLLSEEARTLLEAELRDRQFLPTVLQIVRTTALWPPCQWELRTDRGDVTIDVQSEDELRKLPGGRVLITAGDGLRYQISNVADLDAASRRLLTRYLG